MEKLTHFTGLFLVAFIGASNVEAASFAEEGVRQTLLAGDSIAFFLFFLWVGYVCLFFNGNNFRK